MSAQRISPIVPYGSLLKGESKPKRKAGKTRDVPREMSQALWRDPAYLRLIRRCPCLSCDQDPAGIAAHVRMTRVGKPIAGTGIKPGDQWTLPLCQACHTDGPKAQHKVGEMDFWMDLGIDPISICQRLCSASPDIEAMRQVCFMAREGRA